MSSLPYIRSYGNYKSDNYGSHALRVSFDNLELWYSYRTIVAFRAPGYGLTVRENDWGPTTGKHLNAVEPDKSKRISGKEFERQLSEVLKSFGLSY
jgi:hypothetical protein